MSADNELERIVTSGIGLYPRHWAVVYQFGKDAGRGGKSDAIRGIIEDWQRLKGMERELQERLQRLENTLAARA